MTWNATAILGGMSETKRFEPSDPGFVRRIQESFAQQGLMKHLGARISSIEAGAVEIRTAFWPELTQQDNYFHAGVSSAIGDSACGYAAYTLMATDSAVLTVEFKINLMAPAIGDELIARGRVLRSGRTLKICVADIFAKKGDVETQCATMLATIMGLVKRERAKS